MAKKLKGDQVFTGQLLRGGDVVYLTADGSWASDLQSASVATNDQDLEKLESLASKGVLKNLVVDIYPFVVVRDEAGNLEPDHIREKLRTAGPSIVYS